MTTIKVNAYTTIYKLPKAEYTVNFCTCKEPRETLSAFYSRQGKKPEVLINGGLFNMKDGNPCFNFRDERVNYALASGYQYGMGINDNGEMVTGSAKTNFKDFVSGYPCLVSNGKADKITYAKELDGLNPRTAIGYTDTDYLVLIVDGRTSSAKGATFAELQNIFIKHGAKFAINLDGGGSTRCLVNGNVANKPTEDRAVDNVVCFYKKNTENVATPVSNTNTSVETIIAKCTKKTSVYDINGNLENGRFISVGDMCTFNAKLTNKLLAKVTYPTSKGNREAYIKDISNFQ